MTSFEAIQRRALCDPGNPELKAALHRAAAREGRVLTLRKNRGKTHIGASYRGLTFEGGRQQPLCVTTLRGAKVFFSGSKTRVSYRHEYAEAVTCKACRCRMATPDNSLGPRPKKGGQAP